MLSKTLTARGRILMPWCTKGSQGTDEAETQHGSIGPAFVLFFLFFFLNKKVLLTLLFCVFSDLFSTHLFHRTLRFLRTGT